jgi:apolipoprotein N-acyltransferase
MKHPRGLDTGGGATAVVAELALGSDAACKGRAELEHAGTRIMSGNLVAYGLAAISGLLYATSIPPLSLTLSAWVALAPLFAAVSLLSPGRAALAAVIWTATMVVGVAWYLPGMLSAYFGLHGILSWIGAVAFAIGLVGIYVIAFSAWLAWIVRRGAASPLLIAAGWLACEFARAHGIVANPWALSAYSQMGVTSLIQIADATGPYGLGFLIAAVNACIAAAAAPALRGRWPRFSVVCTVALLIAALVYGQWRLGQTFADGVQVNVAVVQGGTPPSPAGDEEKRAARLATYIELTKSVASTQPALIVWPEYAIENYLQESTPARDAVLHLSEELGADLVLGGPHYVLSPSGTRYHNSVYLVRDGHLAARYDKNRLVPFGEDSRGEWLFGPKAVSYAAGSGGFVLPTSSLHLGAFVCVESMYPELVREAGRAGADVLVNLSNDYWFGYAASARHQLDISALRAVENRRYLLRATPTGYSAVVDPYGRIVAQSEFATPQVLSGLVRAATTVTPYQRWGDAFAWLVIASVAVATIRSLFSRSEEQKRRHT